MPDQTFSAHYISGTHWDREWYRPFQEFRLLLVRLMDGLIDLMERDPEFRYFQLDGQTCILDDYMEIRPENRERLRALMESGRILAGPWFTMPDLFCVGDEALIRNLALGRRICHEWGVEPMPVGFICDMFGHPSQMPQIFQGFGLPDVVLGRGTNEHTTPAYFEWEGPDGTRAFTFKLQDSQGYGAFAVPRTALGEETFLVYQPSMQPFFNELNAAKGDPEAEREVRERWFQTSLSKYVRHETGRANGDVVCLMDSMDHIPPGTEVPRYLRLIESACPEVKPRHSNLPEFFKDARQRAHDVPIKRGELREPAKTRNGYLWLIPYCVSARVGLKLANDRAQNLLEKWVEPLVALANLKGGEIPERYLRVAWEQVLLNHAHDSICGCSIDQVHRDMMYRFDQAITLGEQLRAQAIEVLTRDAKELGQDKTEFTVVLFNPLPVERDEVVVFDIDLPPTYPAFKEGFNTQELKGFILEDAEGNPVQYQRLAMIPSTDERSHYARFCFQSDAPFTRYSVAARVKLPALGYGSLRVRPSNYMPVRPVGSLRTGPTSAANEHLSITIEPDGTLTVTDRASGQTYPYLLLLEDRSEVGDGWFHGHSLNDEQILSTASRAQVSVVHEGPEVVSFRSTVTLDVPVRYDWHTEKGVPETVALRVSNLVTLRKGARVVEVETTVENNAQDHRLRVLLPSGAEGAETYLAHHPYDFVERAITVDPETANWQEAEIQEKPFLHIQAVGNGEKGLAFLSGGGLHEGGVMDDGPRTMTVTLLRSFRKTVSTGGELDGLEQGTIKYKYALMPFSGEFPREAALGELAKLQSGVYSRQSGARPSGFPQLLGDTITSGFMKSPGENLIISAIKPRESGGGLVVRLWNPGDQPATETLEFSQPVASAQRLKLSEEPDTSLSSPIFSGSKIEITAAPHQIATIEVEFGS